MKLYQRRVLTNILGMELWAGLITIIVVTHPGLPSTFHGSHPLIFGVVAGYAVGGFVTALRRLIKNLVAWRRIAAIPANIRWAVDCVDRGRRGYVR